MLKKLTLMTTTGLMMASPIVFAVSCGSTGYVDNKDYKTWGDEEFITAYDNMSYKDDADNAELINEIDYSVQTSNTTYQMLVYSFADGNDDGIGDLIGAKEKIPYLNELGIDQIWLSPIHPASSYHAYDVIDYTAVAPEYGGMEAFDAFLEEAHNNNIKVYLDQVFNHTSYEHPWFQAALADPNSKYRDYYIFSDDDKEGQDDWHQDDSWKMNHFLNDFDRDRTPSEDWYFGDFWAGMPDLNLDNPEVMEEIQHSQRFWTKKGVDGYRYDAFYHFFDGANGQEASSTYTPARVMKELRDASEQGAIEVNRDSEYDTFMFGEWWQTPENGNQYLSYNGERALDSVYDSSLGWDAIPAFTVDAATRKLDSMLAVNPDAQWTPILNHHDINRWLVNYRTNQGISIDEQKTTKLVSEEVNALATSLFGMLAQPSNPIVYYGDELAYFGMKNPGDPSLRESMNWADKKYNVNFYERRSGSSDTIELGVSGSRPTADAQVNKSTTFNAVAEMNDLRVEYPFIGMSDPATLADAATVASDAWSFGTNLRQSVDGSEKVLFAWTAVSERILNLDTAVSKDDLLISGPGVKFDGTTLTIPANSFAAIKL